MIYSARNNGNEHGSVMTNHEVVDFMLDVAGYNADKDLSGIRILEPSVGDGAFLFPILDRLFFSSQKFGFSFEVALKNVCSVEIDSEKVISLRKKVDLFLLEKGVNDSIHFGSNIVLESDFLLSQLGQFDIVIGNPPYVRHELIPDEQKYIYRKLFFTFRHRSDLYIAFFEKSLSMLKKDGKVVFICADRWMKNKYGEKLRNLIQQSFQVSLIVDVDSKDVFEEFVDAYPAITLIEKANGTGFMRERLEHVTDLDVIKRSFLNSNEKNLTHSSPFKSNFESKNLFSIEELGFSVGIGVATGADSVFIRNNNDFSNIENELLMPIIKSKNINEGQINKVDESVLNPFVGTTGELVNLDDYPFAKKYLESHKERLSNRHVAKKNPAKWYKTIDRIYPQVREMPKLLIPDIKKNGESIVLDKGEYYPHHNIYFITHEKNNIFMLEVLGAFLLSEFIRKQMSQVSVLMRGGHFRWQAQNIRKLKIPAIYDLDKNDLKILSTAFRFRDIENINSVVERILVENQSTLTNQTEGRFRINAAQQQSLLELVV